jgi:hypothetical protein
MFRIKFRYDNEEYIKGVWECPKDEEDPEKTYRLSYGKNNKNSSSWTGYVETKDGVIKECNVFIKKTDDIFFGFGSNLFGRFVIKAKMNNDNYWYGIKDYNLTPILREISYNELRTGFKRSRAVAFSLKTRNSTSDFNEFNCVTNGNDFENDFCSLKNKQIDFHKYMWLRHYSKKQRREYKDLKDKEEEIKKINLENTKRINNEIVYIKDKLENIEDEMKKQIIINSNLLQSSILLFNEEKQKQLLSNVVIPLSTINQAPSSSSSSSSSSSLLKNKKIKIKKIKKGKPISKKKQKQLDEEKKVNETRIEHIKELMLLYNNEGIYLTNEVKFNIKKSYLNLKPPSKQLVLKHMFDNKKNCPFGVLKTFIDFDFLTNDGYYWLRESIEELFGS